MVSTPAEDPEKSAGLHFDNEKITTATATKSSRPSHPPRHYGHEAREKLRHFLHPDGKRIHVASSPEEALQLRKKLSDRHEEHEFNVYISGSPEHLDAVREARQHHEARRAELEATHKDIYDRFADVHAELNLLSSELERVTTHGVSLEAHFNRFGYDAHIKSYDDERESPHGSGNTTPRGGVPSRKGSSISEDASDMGTTLKLFKRPVVRQYFHKGILWRASKSEEVQSFELFVDLLYVGIIAINGDATSEDPTAKSLMTFVITFTLSYKIWNDMAQIISWFETDDIFQRCSIIFELVCLFGFTTNITHAFVEGEGSTYATLIGFYLTARLYNAIYLAHIAWVLSIIRSHMIYHVMMIFIGSVLWIASVQVAYPYRLILTWIALIVDTFTPMVLVLSKTAIENFRGVDYFNKLFEFWPAMNIEHRTERQNAFVTLVFGYTVVAMLYQTTLNGIDAFFGKAALGLLQAFCFNWIYFEIDGANLHFHAIRRHKISSMIWNFCHLPFIMAFVLGGGALSRLVIATDSPDSDLAHLTEIYQQRSAPEIRAGIRWFYCAGFGIALACMGVISMSHVHKEVEGLRLKKRYRLAWRFCIALVLICLPFADSLNSLELIGTVTALVVFALGTELWAASCSGESLCSRTKPCRYTGLTGKRKLHAIVEGGKEVDVGSLASGNHSQDGLIVGP
ncbi:hypothetical protein LTR62_005446 [Meristemomyces frigidus]|uniref:Low temperature requirement A protein n=1 Tax=Meristemomyces frigidus TaxID=1508187 RepID=A0AAN7YFC9_9PEZI|nr:hypothetical protein LTR62_005446 [Meristemomyces frigidus]